MTMADTYRVLLVENELPMAVLLMRQLARESPGVFEIFHVDSLAHAVEFLGADSADVIMLDLNLDDSAGIDTFKNIHTCKPDIPVVILSGMMDEAVAIESLQSGAQDYLVKGRSDDHAIVRALRYAIERKRSELEMQKMQEQINQQHRMESLGVLASGIAHEINTPAQFVSANLEFLSKAFENMTGILKKCEAFAGESGGEEARQKAFEDLASALRQEPYKYFKAEMKQTLVESLDGMDRIKNLVRSMKSFCPTSNHLFVPYDVNQIIRDAVNLSRNEWKYVARLKTVLGENLPPCVCCPQELCQAFLNVIINAVHAISEKQAGAGGDPVRGEVVITSCAIEDAVEVSIADNGCGMPDAVKDHVFEPFFTTKEFGKGTGQGLSLAYNMIVNKHGGKISFVSTAAEGTIFTVIIPVNTDKMESSGADATAEFPGRL